MSTSSTSGWSGVPVFGSPPGEGAVVRPSAYALVSDGAGRLAIVRAPQGLFLPGGGMEPGETVDDAVVREAREECGLRVRAGAWRVRAIDFVWSPSERTHFEKRSTFVAAQADGAPAAALEADHALEWITAAEASERLAHPSHRWAAAQWQARGADE